MNDDALKISLNEGGYIADDDLSRVYGPDFTDADTVESFIGPHGSFLKQIKEFVPREGQLKLSQHVKASFDRGGTLIAEAGTGTGKTYAYLLPILLSGKTAVISTGSKALQDQLVKKDLPRICDLLHVEHCFFALKGLSNYLCKKRFADYQARFQNSNGLGIEDPEGNDGLRSRADFIKKVQILAIKQQRLAEEDSPECTFAEINSEFPKDFVQQICCDKHTCRGKSCRFRNSCFAILARQKAVSSKIVVINHALFFADFKVDDVFDEERPCILLPKYKLLVFDEAHMLPDEGRNHLGSELSFTELKKIGDSIKQLIDQDKLEIKDEFLKGYEKLSKASSALFDYLSERGCPAHRNFLCYRYQDYEENRNAGKEQILNLKFRDLMAALWSGIVAMCRFLDDCKEYDEEAFSSMLASLHKMKDTLESLMELKAENKGLQKNANVGSVEVSKRGYSLKITPLEISSLFGNFLNKCEEHRLGVLATSATLSVAGRFDKFRRDIGASSKNLEELAIPSAFDYRNHAGLWISEEFPEPNTAGREGKLVKLLAPLLEENQGGIFFLTTSNNALMAVAAGLRSQFGKKRTVLVQNEGLSNTKLLSKFRKVGNAILVGTTSFWAGVDVQGQALSLVVIDKLPFKSPSDPVYAARCEYYDSKCQGQGRSFIDISVPEAVIELRQGTGRLIRHEDDTGGLVICDPRLLKKRYGSLFLKSLPPVTMCNSLNMLQDFLRSLHAKPAIKQKGE